jgi:hypothetical protein
MTHCRSRSARHSCVAVAVRVFQADLVHVLMGVLGPVVVGVGVLVGHVVVRMRGVRMCVSLFAVVVLVRVRRVMGVLVGHGCQLSLRIPLRNMLFLLRIQFAWVRGDDSAAAFRAFNPPSAR